MATISGQCHCGQVKYESAGPVFKSSYCDCRGCRRATGTLKAPFVTVPRDSLKLAGGPVAEYHAWDSHQTGKMFIYVSVKPA